MKKLLILIVALAACSQRAAETPAERTLSGKVFKGPVAAGRLEFRDAISGHEIGSAATEDDGSFVASIPSRFTFVESCVYGGSYIDEVSGVEVPLGEHRFCSLNTFELAEAEAAIVVSPISHLLASRARGLVRSSGRLSLLEAFEEARRDVSDYFTCGDEDYDLVNVVPVLPSDDNIAAIDNNSALLAGFIIYGFSKQAEQLSISRGLTGGIGITAITLLSALAKDLEYDGVFDGNAAVQLEVEGVAIGPGLLRDGAFNLASMIEAFVEGEGNRSMVTVADLNAPLECMRTSRARWFEVNGQIPDSGIPSIEKVGEWGNEGIVEISFRTFDRESDIDLAYFEPHSAIREQGSQRTSGTTEAWAKVDTRTLSDGEHGLTGASKDTAGNLARKTLVLRSENGAPVINCDSVTGSLQGLTSLSFSAIDAAGIEVLKVEGHANGTDADLIVEIDTVDAMGHVDGELVLKVSATDGVGHTGERECAYSVDNYQPTTLRVFPNLGMPIGDALITAYEYVDGERGAALASADASTLGYTLTLPDTWAGKVVIVADISDRIFTDAAGKDWVAPAGTFLKSIVDYRPTIDGEEIRVAVDALTTLSTDLDSAYRKASVNLDGPGIVAEHLLAPYGGVLHTLLTPSAVEPAVGTGPLEFRKLLVHAGLTVMATTWTANNTEGSAFSILDALRLLSLDARDTLLDGYTVAGVRLRVSPGVFLSPETFRRELSSSIAEFLAGTSNSTGLTLDNAALPNGTLDVIASSDSPLFPASPEVKRTSEHPSLSHGPIPSVLTGDTRLLVEGQSKDGISRVGVSFNGEENVSAEVSRAELSPALDDLNNGRHLFTVWAEDYVGRRSQESWVVQVIKERPSISVNMRSSGQLEDQATATNGAQLEFLNRELALYFPLAPRIPNPSVAYEVDLELAGITYSVPAINLFGANLAHRVLELPECGTFLPVTVNFRFPGGTETTKFDVRCITADDFAITVTEAFYVPATLESLEMPTETYYTPTGFDQTAVSIAGCSFTEQSPCPLQLWSEVQRPNLQSFPEHYTHNRIKLRLDYDDYGDSTRVTHFHQGHEERLQLNADGDVTMQDIRIDLNNTDTFDPMRRPGIHRIEVRRQSGIGPDVVRNFFFDVELIHPPVFVECTDSLGTTQEDLFEFMRYRGPQVDSPVFASVETFVPKFHDTNHARPKIQLKLEEEGRSRVGESRMPTGPFLGAENLGSLTDEEGMTFWYMPHASDLEYRWLTRGGDNGSCWSLNGLSTPDRHQPYLGINAIDPSLEWGCRAGHDPAKAGEPLYPYEPWALNLLESESREAVVPGEWTLLWTSEPGPAGLGNRPIGVVELGPTDLPSGVEPGWHMVTHLEQGLLHRITGDRNDYIGGLDYGYYDSWHLYSEYEYKNIIDSIEVTLSVELPEKIAHDEPIPVVYGPTCQRSWNTNVQNNE